MSHKNNVEVRHAWTKVNRLFFFHSNISMQFVIEKLFYIFENEEKQLIQWLSHLSSTNSINFLISYIRNSIFLLLEALKFESRTKSLSIEADNWANLKVSFIHQKMEKREAEQKQQPFYTRIDNGREKTFSTQSSRVKLGQKWSERERRKLS